MERFLELHGNTQLREQSGEYVAQRGKVLADVVLACSAGERPAAAGGERARLLALFDLSMLRYKERDALVDVFRRCDSPARYTRLRMSHTACHSAGQLCRPGAVCDEQPARRAPPRLLRVRVCCAQPCSTKLLTCHRFPACSERYDARQNVHDYDYHMRLADAGGTLIHAAHFREWRDSGLAYQFRDASYPAPNRSLASEVHGQRVAARDRNGKELGRQARALAWSEASDDDAR